jgi:hypothetical protein
MGLEKLAENLAEEIGTLRETVAYVFCRLEELSTQAKCLMWDLETERHAKKKKPRADDHEKHVFIHKEVANLIKRKPGRPKKKRGPGRPRKVEQA